MKEAVAVIDRHLISLAIALQHIDDDVPKLQTWGRTAGSVLIAGGRLFACGAGTCAQQARHLVAELSGLDDDRPPLAVATLSGSSDMHYCNPGDIMLCLSATGAEEEIAASAVAASEMSVKTWALTGPAPNAVAASCAEAVSVDAPATSTVEEVHLAAIHILCAALNSAVRDAISAGQPLAGQPLPLLRPGRSAA